MRIALVSEHASPLAPLGGEDAGGQNVHVASLAAGLARRGVEVDVYTRRDSADLTAEVHTAAGYRVVHVDAGPAEPVPKDELFSCMDDFAACLDEHWRAEPPDLVHAHFWMSGWASLLATRHRRVPLVQTFHALGAVKRRHQGAKDTSPYERLAIERRLIAEADHIVATCSDEVFELRQQGAVRSAVSVIPCGVDTSRFTPDGPRAPRSERFAHRVVAVGRLVERKGVANVIRAVAGIPSCELVVAGGPGPDIDRLRNVAAEAGAADRVVFAGSVPQVLLPDLYRSADLVACAPWYEPFGIVPLEAMACGVPVVASAVGGLVDTVVHGETGLHVPPRDVGGLRTAIAALLEDGDLRAAMGRAAVARARERYDWTRVTDAHLATYTELTVQPLARQRRAAGEGRSRSGGTGA